MPRNETVELESQQTPARAACGDFAVSKEQALNLLPVKNVVPVKGKENLNVAAGCWHPRPRAFWDH